MADSIRLSSAAVCFAPLAIGSGYWQMMLLPPTAQVWPLARASLLSLRLRLALPTVLAGNASVLRGLADVKHMDPLSSQPDTSSMAQVLMERRSQQLQKLAGQNAVQLIEGAAQAQPPMPPGATFSVYA